MAGTRKGSQSRRPAGTSRPGDHISWSFPFKPPLVNGSGGGGVCFAPATKLRLDEYSCSSKVLLSSNAGVC